MTHIHTKKRKKKGNWSFDFNRVEFIWKSKIPYYKLYLFLEIFRIFKEVALARM